MKLCPAYEREFKQDVVCSDNGAPLIAALGGAPDPLIGSLLKDTYRIEARLAAASRGVIYRGTQLPIGRQVTVEVLTPELGCDPALIKRFFHEARALGELSHPNFLQLFDCGNTGEGLFYLVTELPVGETLEDRVMRAPLAWAEVVAIMTQIGAGVREAHRREIVHGDLKPSNVFLVESKRSWRQNSPEVKLLDFGISKSLERSDPEPKRPELSMASKGYVAPEQITGDQPATPRSDIYSLGAILYFTLAQRPPYSGSSPESVIAKQLDSPPDPIDLAMHGAPAEVQAVLERALARDPAARYASADEFAEALRACPTPRTGGQDPLRLATAIRPSTWPVARLLRFLGLGLLAGLLLSGAAYLLLRAERSPPVPVVLPPAALRATGVALPQGVTEDSIRLGMSAAFTGPVSELGRSMKVGVLTFIGHQNAEGGVHGRKLSLIALDDSYDPVRAHTNALALLDEHKVFAFIGNVGTPNAKVTSPLVLGRRVLFFAPVTGSELVRTTPPDRYLFHFRASYAEEIAALVDHLVRVRQIPADQIALFAQDDSFGDSGMAGLTAALQGHGVEPGRVLRVGYKPNTTDVRPAVQTILRERSRAAAVVLISKYLPATEFIRGLKKRGYKGPLACISFVDSAALSAAYQKSGDSSGAGVIVSEVVPPVRSELAPARHFREHLAELFPGETPTAVAFEGYLAASVLALALEKAGPSLTTEGLVGALESLRDFDLDLGEKLHLGPSKHQASDKVWLTALNAKGEVEPLE